MSEPVWLPYELIVDLQAEQLQEHGGASGLRDENGLRSSLARPRQIATYEPGGSLFRLAAAYAYGLTRNPRSSTATNVQRSWRWVCSRG